MPHMSSDSFQGLGRAPRRRPLLARSVPKASETAPIGSTPAQLWRDDSFFGRPHPFATLERGVAMKYTVVRYKLKPECVAEHETLLAAVFVELERDRMAEIR